MVILGIDPGYGTVGFGVVESLGGNKIRPIEYGVIQTPKEDSLPKRLKIIADGFDYIIDKYRPEAVAIEELFFQNNQKTAIAVAEARGAILLTVYNKCKNLYEYTPMQIKQALTGYGLADKKQIQYMVKVLLKLDSVPKPDDAADALAVAVTHAQVSRTSGLFGI
ncbi:MAG: crossover junction endodeoxyribonuclease RuvC [Christensenellales bacterium]